MDVSMYPSIHPSIHPPSSVRPAWSFSCLDGLLCFLLLPIALLIFRTLASPREALAACSSRSPFNLRPSIHPSIYLFLFLPALAGRHRWLQTFLILSFFFGLAKGGGQVRNAMNERMNECAHNDIYIQLHVCKYTHTSPPHVWLCIFC